MSEPKRERGRERGEREGETEGGERGEERGAERGYRESTDTQLNIFKHTQHVQKSRPALEVRERESKIDGERETDRKKNSKM